MLRPYCWDTIHFRYRNQRDKLWLTGKLSLFRLPYTAPDAAMEDARTTKSWSSLPWIVYAIILTCLARCDYQGNNSILVMEVTNWLLIGCEAYSTGMIDIGNRNGIPSVDKWPCQTDHEDRQHLALTPLDTFLKDRVMKNISLLIDGGSMQGYTRIFEQCQ